MSFESSSYFSLSLLRNRTVFTDPKTKVNLWLDDQVHPTDYDSVVVTYHSGNHELIITGRDIPEYHALMGNIGFQLDQQWMEVGTGLSELLPTMVTEVGSRLRHKPIIIDPTDYTFVRDHLTALLDEKGGDPVVQALQGRIEEFIRRCTILLGEGVLHLRMTLSEALNSHSEKIRGQADRLLSMFSVGIHGDPEHPCPQKVEEDREGIQEMLEQLLRPSSGILIKSPDLRFDAH